MNIPVSGKVFAVALSVLTVAALASTASADSLVRLSDLRTFEVDHFQPVMGTEKTDSYLAETNYYLRYELERSDVIQYDTPADGVVHVDCAGFHCRQLDVKVTHGPNGEVVWQERMENHRMGIPYEMLRNPKSIAARLAGRLEEAYKMDADSKFHNVSDTSAATAEQRIEPMGAATTP